MPKISRNCSEILEITFFPLGKGNNHLSPSLLLCAEKDEIYIWLAINRIHFCKQRQRYPDGNCCFFPKIGLKTGGSKLTQRNSGETLLLEKAICRRQRPVTITKCTKASGNAKFATTKRGERSPEFQDAIKTRTIYEMITMKDAVDGGHKSPKQDRINNIIWKTY